MFVFQRNRGIISEINKVNKIITRANHSLLTSGATSAEVVYELTCAAVVCSDWWKEMGVGGGGILCGVRKKGYK